MDTTTMKPHVSESANFDYEIFEMFKDQCYAQLPSMEEKILHLSNPEKFDEATNDLFRMFHNYKSTTKYLGLDNIYSVVDKTEHVLSSLRSLDVLHDEDIIEWLLKIKDQFEMWMDEMDLGSHTFSECNPDILAEITLTDEAPKPSEVIKTLNILYLDSDTGRAPLIAKALSKTLKEVKVGDSIEALNLYAHDEKPDIILLNLKKGKEKYFETIFKKFPKVAIIAVFDKVTRSLLLELGQNGVGNVLTNPIKGTNLKRELLSIAHGFFSERRVLINNKKIFKFIEDLKPLPNTIMQIQQICDDEELSINDLVEVVKGDPVVVGVILNAANNPIYGIKAQNPTIENVIAIFGKKTIKAICYSMMSSYLGDMRLKAYGINEETFAQVGATRLSLMNEWYKHVDKTQLGILSSTAILGNLGQLLISSEVESLNIVDEFLESTRDFGFAVAEEKHLHTNNTFVTSDILSFWHLKNEIIDSIKYSADLNNAPLEVRSLAVANHIVYKLVDLDGSIAPTVSQDILSLMSEEGLEANHLINALAKLIPPE